MFKIQDALAKKSLTQKGMPLVMGILNVTPDSFSDGGRFVTKVEFSQQVCGMVAAGVDVVDIGGESTRPGATPVTLQQELDRVMPVVEWVKTHFDTPISIDTYKTEVMQEAVRLGASMINDVNALQADGAIECAINSGVAVCLMHKLCDSSAIKESLQYQEVVSDVCEFLLNRAEACRQAGMDQNQIILDPGFGFDKNLEHNTALFKNLGRLTALGYPVLVGVSRKRMIGQILENTNPQEREVGSVAAAVLAAAKGANMVRVHDVKSTVDALRVTMHLQ